VSVKPLEPLDDETVLDYARQIVTDKMLVADLSDRDWQMSLALIISAMDEDGGPEIPPNIGAVLVPVAPHLKGYWLNGRVPGVTISAVLVASESMDPLRAQVSRMLEALGIAEPAQAE
jgi:hypothetical protein